MLSVWTVLYTEGYLFHPQVQAHLGGGIIKWQETHWNLILCIPGVCVCVVQDSSSSAYCVLHQRHYSLLRQLWTAYRSSAFVPSDPGGDMTFYAYCSFLLVTCYLCLRLLFRLVHNDLACFLDERIPNVVRKKLTHVLHSLIHSFTHYVPVVALRRQDSDTVAVCLILTCTVSPFSQFWIQMWLHLITFGTYGDPSSQQVVDNM